MDAKKFAPACPKLEQATKLLPTGIGTRLALAECYVGLGRLASAQGQYLQAEALARAAKDPRAKEAASEAAKLKPKLATIRLIIPDELRSVEGLSITWDGFALDPATWETAIPVDTGKHIIEATASSWRPWREEVTIEGKERAFEQKVPMLEKLPEEKPKPPPDDVPKKPPPSTSTWMRPVGIAGAGVGVASLIAGGVLGGLAMSRFDASNAEGKCDAKNFCNAVGVTLRGESLGFARGSTVLIPVGAALTAGGLALVIVASHKDKQAAFVMTRQIQWQVETTPGWVGLRGVW